VIALSVVEVAVLYLLPVAFFVAVWLIVALVIYLAVRSRLDFAFKHDLLRKFGAKRKLRSGRERLTFPYVAKLIIGDNCIQALLLYRVSHFLARHRLRGVAEMLHAFSRLVTHADISPLAEIGPGLYLYHGHGTVVGKGVRIGQRGLICQGVSVGGATIGDDVKIWAGAKIIGKVTLGDRSEVGANTVVLADVPADAIVFGVPARLAGSKARTDEAGAETPSARAIRA
jgi:serine O-acetyltransferase